MRDEEAQAIKERWNWNLVDALPTGSQAKADVRALLAERAALLEAVESLLTYATKKRYADWCVWCDAQGQNFEWHDADCPVTKARALLEGTRP